MMDAQDTDKSGMRAALNVKSLAPTLVWMLCWLVWLPLGFITPLTELFQSHPTIQHLSSTLAGCVLFIGMYLWITWRNALGLVAATPPLAGTQILLWWPLVALSVLSLIIVGSNGVEWGGLFIFASVSAAGRLPTTQAVWTIIALTLISVVGTWLHSPDILKTVTSLIFVSVPGITVIGMVRLARTSRELRIARAEIARLAVMTERLRIARDLHDLLGHNLSLIALKSELAGRLIAVSPARASVEISDVEKVARTTLQEVREAVAAYRQPTLSGELHGAQEILTAAGIVYSYEGDEESLENLPTALETVLAWIVREGVTNVVRHSRAHHCTISFERNKSTICVKIIDDGKGVSQLLEATPIDVTVNKGNGLHGLSERVTALGGECEAVHGANGGFRLAVLLPVAPVKQIDREKERSSAL